MKACSRCARMACVCHGPGARRLQVCCVLIFSVRIIHGHQARELLVVLCPELARLFRTLGMILSRSRLRSRHVAVFSERLLAKRVEQTAEFGLVLDVLVGNDSGRQLSAVGTARREVFLVQLCKQNALSSQHTHE